jgi:hypothetical protein
MQGVEGKHEINSHKVGLLGYSQAAEEISDHKESHEPLLWGKAAVERVFAASLHIHCHCRMSTMKRVHYPFTCEASILALYGRRINVALAH